MNTIPLHSPNLCLAPMRGVTTNVYRHALEQCIGGFDRAMAPFIPSVNAARIKPRLLNDILPERNGTLPLVPQCIGRDPDELFLLLRAMADLGYTEANWNLGCPWPQVTKKRRGAGLLPHPDLIEAVLDRVFADPPLALSVKVRLGLDTPDALEPLFPLFNRYPLSEIIIHPRTASQMYEGTADVEAFARCLPQTHHTLCYNGDIFTPARFNELQTRFPSVHRWMLGRGALRNPFLAEEIARKNPPRDKTEKIDLIRTLHDTIYRHYRDTLFGPSPVLGKMKELWTYLACSVVSSRPVFKRIKKTQTLSHYEQVVREIFADAAWQPDQTEIERPIPDNTPAPSDAYP
ncbi:MAG: tRNA-dihydrouridine synthase family protein [Kiritimatiellae bacterium]|nr:tRNA-dihydrouridine synthase family protein [Kiritimatiellia bacterium]